MRPVVVIGEAVADAIARPRERLRLDVLPGGSPANTAVGLARLGTPTRFLGRLSTGVLGRLLRAHLKESGVDVSGCVDTTDNATLAITSVDDQGRADYGLYVADTADRNWRDGELDETALGQASIVHTGSLALALSPGAERITEALARAAGSTTISVDPNVRPGIASPEEYRRRFDEWSGLADVLKASEDDLALLYPDTDPETVCARLHDRGVRLAVVTRGGAGALVSFDGRTAHVDGVPVTVADTIGAGDAFSAGLLHHVATAGGVDALSFETVREAARFATRVAARTCQAVGADPPWMDDLD